MSRRKTTEAPARVVNPLFDRAFYAESYPLVVKGGKDLYDHYVYFGFRNGYDPNPYFDSAWYLAQNTDVAATGANPLDHYLGVGATEGRDPCPGFSSWLYLLAYPDVKSSGANPLLHFIQHGQAEGRRAMPVLLFPSQTTMSAAQDDDVDARSLSAAEPTIRLIESWIGKLLDRITASAPIGQSDTRGRS